MTFKREWALYECINAVPNVEVWEIAWGMGWSYKRVNKYVKRLIEHGLIEKDIKGYCSIDWKDLVNWDNMNTKREDYK